MEDLHWSRWTFPEGTAHGEPIIHGRQGAAEMAPCHPGQDEESGMKERSWMGEAIWGKEGIIFIYLSKFFLLPKTNLICQ